jgi:hypothetical protein
MVWKSDNSYLRERFDPLPPPIELDELGPGKTSPWSLLLGFESVLSGGGSCFRFSAKLIMD